MGSFGSGIPSGNSENATKKYAEAEPHLLQAQRIAKSFGRDEFELDVLKELMPCYCRRGMCNVEQPVVVRYFCMSREVVWQKRALAQVIGFAGWRKMRLATSICRGKDQRRAGNSDF